MIGQGNIIERPNGYRVGEITKAATLIESVWTDATITRARDALTGVELRALAALLRSVGVETGAARLERSV